MASQNRRSAASRGPENTRDPGVSRLLAQHRGWVRHNGPTMATAGKHSGERPEPAAGAARPLRRLPLLAAGITVTLVAWGFLVWSAIDFGTRGRNGEGLAWAFLALATIGAAACLFLTLLLGGRLAGTLRGELPSSASPPGGRRAAR